MASGRSARGGSAPWNKVDKVLLSFSLAFLTLSVIFSVTVLKYAVHRARHYDTFVSFRGAHRGHGGHHPAPHHDSPPATGASHQHNPFVEEVDCEIDGFDDTQEDVQCMRNVRTGEWCAARQPPPGGAGTPLPMHHRQRRDKHRSSHGDSSEEDGWRRHHGHDGESGAMAPHRGGDDAHRHPQHDDHGEPILEPMLPLGGGVRQDPARHFPCMRMRVHWFQNQQRMRSMAHVNLSEALNFPSCTFSACGQNSAMNQQEVEQLRREAEAMSHQPTRCLRNPTDPNHVIILRSQHINMRTLLRSCGFHLTLWSLVAGLVFLTAFIVRRCATKKTDAKAVGPAEQRTKLPGGAYIVTAPTASLGMTDKEKEAFGLAVPMSVVSDGPPPNAPKEFLMLAPPAYEISTKPSDMLPPAYDSTSGK